MKVIAVRGAGEEYRHNMTMSALRGMPSVSELSYPASIAPIGLRTYAESVSLGRGALRAIDADGEPWVGAAYSLGAAVLGDFVQYDRPRNCRGIVLLSDPKRHANQVSHKGVPKGNWGIAGQRFIDRVPCYSYTIPDDPISALPGDNGMRQIAQQVTGLMQPLPARWWDAGYTIHWLLKYTTGGRHTAYGTERINGSTYLQSVKAMVEGLTR